MSDLSSATPDEQLADRIFSQARAAQAALMKCSQEQVDAFVKEFATVLCDHDDELAKMVVEESGMGNYADKIVMHRTKAENIYADIKTLKTVGIIREDHAAQVVEIAEPVGIVVSLTPCTNPTGGAMSNSMYAIKGRNSIIICPHPRAKKVTAYTVDLMVKAATAKGLPANAIQCIPEPSKELSKILMSRANYVLATGGAAMVKVAYSSGVPAYGVGAGNVPVFVDATTDITRAVSDICTGKLFDNGLICSSEQVIIAIPSVMDQVEAALKAKGAFFVTGADKEKLQNLVFPNNAHFPSTDAIGQSVQTLASRAGLSIPESTTGPLVVPIEAIGPSEPFSGEKLSPILALYRVPDRESGVRAARAFLDYQGAGHTSAIHSEDRDFVLTYALAMNTSRVIVNQSSALGAGGNRQNGLVPTTMLGCGSWGNNASSNNVSARELINIKRVSFKWNEARHVERLGSK